MKYVITGSTGHISKPIAQQLVASGHQVTVVTSSSNKVDEIKSMGATAAVGTVTDADFLKQAFNGADAVYLMIPPNFGVTNWLAYQQDVADKFVQAIAENNIQHVVVLSSVGAHMGKGAGPVDGLAYLEQVLAGLDVKSVFLRPSYFYYNLFAQIGMIKHAGIMGSAQPAQHKMVLTHTSDIASVAVDALLGLNFGKAEVRYIGSDECTWEEITNVLSAAVNKAGIPYVEFTDEQSRQGMLQAGLSEVITEGYVTMGAALRSGEMEADYWKHKPTQLGKVKLSDFAKEFAAVYAAS